jgi:hypothetical protein
MNTFLVFVDWTGDDPSQGGHPRITDVFDDKVSVFAAAIPIVISDINNNIRNIFNIFFDITKPPFVLLSKSQNAL